MLEEKEICSLTSKGWSSPKPILSRDSVGNSLDCSYFLLEVASEQEVSYGFVCSIPAENIFSGQIHCHENIFVGRSRRVYQDFSRDWIQRNPTLLITDIEPFWRSYAAKRRHLKCVKTILQTDGTSYRLFELPEEIDRIRSLDSSLYLADGHHRFHAFRKLYESSKDLSKASLACAIFHVSDVQTSRKGMILDQDCSVDSLFQHLSLFLPFRETDRERQCLGVKIWTKNKWYEMSFEYPEMEKIFPHVALREILDESDAFKEIEFNLFPEKNGLSLEEEIEKQPNGGIIFPADDPMSVLNFSLSGGLFEANSTFFQPKFPNNLITHVFKK